MPALTDVDLHRVYTAARWAAEHSGATYAAAHLAALGAVAEAVREESADAC